MPESVGGTIEVGYPFSGTFDSLRFVFTITQISVDVDEVVISCSVASVSGDELIQNLRPIECWFLGPPLYCDGVIATTVRAARLHIRSSRPSRVAA